MEDIYQRCFGCGGGNCSSFVNLWFVRGLVGVCKCAAMCEGVVLNPNASRRVQSGWAKKIKPFGSGFKVQKFYRFSFKLVDNCLLGLSFYTCCQRSGCCFSVAILLTVVSMNHCLLFLLLSCPTSHCPATESSSLLATAALFYFV